MACGILIGFWLLLRPERWWGFDQYALHLLEKARTAPELKAVRAVQNLAKLGDPGLRALVAAIQLPRKPVAQAASDVLLEDLERWRVELNYSHASNRSQIARKISLLAKQFANAMEESGPEAQIIAARLARKFLILAIQFPAADQGNLIGHCETILNAAGAPYPRKIYGAAGIPPQPFLGQAGIGRPPLERSDYEQLAPLSSSGLFLEQPARMLPSAHQPPQPSYSDPNKTPGLDRLAILAPELAQNADTFRGVWRSWNRSQSQRGAAKQESLNGRQPMRGGQPIPAVGDARVVMPMDHLSLREVMDLLHHTHRPTAVAAARELQIRGFSAIELVLAQKMTAPDVSVRRQLIEEVQSIPDLNGRPWLFWLAADPDPEIRLAAMTVLATSADPATCRHLFELAARDRDPRIAALAERLESLGR